MFHLKYIRIENLQRVLFRHYNNFRRRIYEPIPSYCLLLICCACTDNKSPRNSTRSATRAIRRTEEQKCGAISDDGRDPWSGIRQCPDGQIIVFLHRDRVRFLLYSCVELATPKATRVESHPHGHTRGKFASYSKQGEYTRNSLQTSILSTRED